MDMTKRDEALVLAEELLGDIELRRLEPLDIARKASRLARLSDDSDAMSWLQYEVAGYPETKGLEPAVFEAARRSNRVYSKDDTEYARVSGIGQLQASIDALTVQLSTSSPDNIAHRNKLAADIVAKRGALDRIIGSIHSYVHTQYQALRFGAGVESVFDALRSQVDSSIVRLVPEASLLLTTALENAGGNNPVQWGNAAKACRDLIKACADALRPSGKPKNGISMTEASYINRLVDWIKTNSKSGTMRDLVLSDLNDLGNRLDAVTDGGNKGAHTKVTKEESTRYIIGTYMLMGDILALEGSGNSDFTPKTAIEESTGDTADTISTSKESSKKSVNTTKKPTPKAKLKK